MGTGAKVAVGLIAAGAVGGGVYLATRPKPVPQLPKNKNGVNTNNDAGGGPNFGQILDDALKAGKSALDLYGSVSAKNGSDGNADGYNDAQAEEQADEIFAQY